MEEPSWSVHLPAELRGADLDLVAEGSLPRSWVRRWEERPDAPVLHDPTEGWITAAELEQRSRAVAGRLAQEGVVEGDRVLMSAGSTIRLVVSYVGALRLGAVVVPVNTAYREREIAHIVRDARPVAAIVDDDERAAWMRAASVGPLAIVRPEPAADGRQDDPELDRAGPGDLALLCYTSGTTGAPKGAMLRHANLLASVEAVRLAWRWTPEDRLVLALPLFHVHGLGVGINGTLHVGAGAVLLPRFDADAVFDAVADHEASMFFGVPTMYDRLAASPRVRELGRLRLGVSGSAPLPAALHRRLAEDGGLDVLERYGMSETLMNVSNPLDGERRAGTVGLPLPGVELRLGEAPDVEGEVLLRGPNVFSGYWERLEATAAAFDADGWFRTGDLGALDADGYLRIVGRRTELIISGGYNVYPREVEDVLLAHPQVAEVAVVGVPSAEWGEVVTAFVVPVSDRAQADRAGLDPDDLAAFAGTRLASYKCPRQVHVVESLPRNALGKVLKHELAARHGP